MPDPDRNRTGGKNPQIGNSKQRVTAVFLSFLTENPGVVGSILALSTIKVLKQPGISVSVPLFCAAAVTLNNT
jgi:hypothetical protein